MRTRRPYVQIDPDELERIRQIDLLTYLRKFEPSNVEEVKGTTNVYRTVDHDSLKISNGKWFWWSQGIGGYSALDYLIKVRDYSFMEAVEILTGKDVRGKVILQPQGKEFFTCRGKNFFTSCGKEFFT